MARDIYELLGVKRFSLRADVTFVAIMGLLYGAYSLGLIGSKEAPVEQPSFDQAAAAAQAKADQRAAQAEAARKEAMR